MYAGTTFRHGSGRIVGVHQRIDKAARLTLNNLLDDKNEFPGIKKILHFEGKNGSDGLSLKGSFEDIPWHFIDPNNPDDKAMLVIIENHVQNLINSLKIGDTIKASFDAAWLAHAVTDGLTPVHHYPLGQKIEELFGKPHDERKSLKGKNVIKGKNRRDTLSKNWQYWGVGGVFTSHLSYEMGVASAISTENFDSITISESDINDLIKYGFSKIFIDSVNAIHKLNIHNRYIKNGWTVKLANETKRVLLPEIIKNVVLAWYCAVLASRKVENES